MKCHGAGMLFEMQSSRPQALSQTAHDSLHIRHAMQALPDSLQSLAQIRSRAGQPLVNALLAIASDAGPAPSWIETFECLYLADGTDDHARDAGFFEASKRRRGPPGLSGSRSATARLLKRRNLDPLARTDSSRNYVAVSYTWDLSHDEDPSICSYLIETRERRPRAVQSTVRDSVWDRALRFAKHAGCPNVWVDGECIDQKNPVEKQAAIQSMHLVYELSKHPVALLTCAIKSKPQLMLLRDLFNGKFSAETQGDTLELIRYITSDRWWNRAWPFQEDYRASVRMKLLIPHGAQLENEKRNMRSPNGASLFGAIKGEITLNSSIFKKQATRFCLAFQKQHGPNLVCQKVFDAAGRYTELLKENSTLPGMPAITRSMSPKIFADICRRGIEFEIDRLAIIANCCGYDTRLSTIARGISAERECSLSLCMMVLFLLNGELMENDPARQLGSLEDSVLAYITKQSLRSFRPVVYKELTFIKQCRFVQPKLTADGIRTKGHVWALGKTIRREAVADQDLTTSELLQALSNDLSAGTFGEEYTDLAEKIDWWIGSNQAARASFSSQHPTSQWLDLMADEIGESLREGLPLRLGTLVLKDDMENVKESGRRQPTAIFVTEDDTVCVAGSGGQPEHVFTSYRWATGGADELDKHVSLQVRLVDPKSGMSNTDAGHRATRSVVQMKLYVDRWVNGLCFFDGHTRQEVLFPLPSALTE
ncbi:HET domain-containing protein [Microdochium nivale]|nr:HET domain-containing protein [Microdochium nivale]